MTFPEYQFDRTQKKPLLLQNKHRVGNRTFSRVFRAYFRRGFWILCGKQHPFLHDLVQQLETLFCPSCHLWFTGFNPRILTRNGQDQNTLYLLWYWNYNCVQINNLSQCINKYSNMFEYSNIFLRILIFVFDSMQFPEAEYYSNILLEYFQISAQ